MLDVTRHRGIAVLTMSDGKVQALDDTMMECIIDALESCRDDSALILTGMGKAFSAGVNLHKILEGGKSYTEKFLPLLDRMLEKLYLFPNPVIAAINGHALAGGCILANACDYQIMSSGKIGVTELLVGVPFPTLALNILKNSLESKFQEESIYFGKIYSTEMALERGLIREIATPEALMTRSFEAAEQFTSIPPAAFSLTKRQLRQPVVDHARKYGFEAEILIEWLSPQTHDRIRAYMDKTTRGKKVTAE